jgi:F0F1-type ATP synthase assembly protein I
MRREKESGWNQAMRYSSLAMLLPISTFAGYAIGYGLDHVFGTGFLKIVFLILGTVSGFVEFIRVLSREPK